MLISLEFGVLRRLGWVMFLTFETFPPSLAVISLCNSLNLDELYLMRRYQRGHHANMCGKRGITDGVLETHSKNIEIND